MTRKRHMSAPSLLAFALTHTHKRHMSALSLLAFAFGCGSVSGSRTKSESGSGSENGGDVAASGDVAQNLCAPATPARVRRLTRSEYDHSVSDLLAQDLSPSTAFPIDSQFGGYTNQSDALVVSPLFAEAMAAAAEELSGTALTNLAMLVPCAPANGDEACARKFIDSFGARAYRRPLVADESEGLLKVYQAGITGGDFKSGIGLVLEVMFQSPNFLYRTELGDTPAADGTVTLTPREIASQISYLVLGGPPDAPLLAAADAGTLARADAREAQVRRLLAMPKARSQVSAFVDQWLGIDRIEQVTKDTAIFPAFTPDMPKLWRQETDSLVQYVVFDGDGMLGTLFNANYTFANTKLAKYYGLTDTSATFKKVMLKPAERAGILTHGSVLATHAQSTQGSPVRRGKFVRTRLLCQTLPPPPKNLMVMPPPPSTMNTTRERFKNHASGTCVGCHSQMDPIGFGFENFDGVGQYRTMENGFPVDASGELTGTKDADGTFNGVVELARLLENSGEVRECFTKNWLQFSMARGSEVADSCTLDAAFKTFQAGQSSIKDLVVNIVRTGEFVRRAPLRQ